LDILPGRGHGVIGTPQLIDGLLYFAGTSDGQDVNLWRTDGTAEGTYELADVYPVFKPPYYDTDVLTDTAFYFVGGGAAGREVYQLMRDSTQEVSLYADINPGPGSSAATDLQGSSEGIYLRARTEDGGAMQLIYLTASLPEPPVSTTGFSEATTARVYPNPATNWLHIAVERPDEFTSAFLYDGLGRSVMEQPFSGTSVRFNVANLPAGSYFVSLISASGYSVVQPVVVRK
jgi:ELWxxDGT repeat protein